jgi:hypothetical protein
MPRKKSTRANSKAAPEPELVLTTTPEEEPGQEFAVPDPPAAAPSGQLVVQETEHHPVVVFNGLNQEQLDRALSIFTPPVPTKVSLSMDQQFMLTMAEVVGHMEAIVFLDKTGRLFPNNDIANHFDNVIIQTLEPDEDGDPAKFSVNEWYSDTRGPIPASLQNWDPSGYAPMPQYEGPKVNWYDELINMELRIPGFVKLIKNCIDLEEVMNRTVQKQRQAAASVWNARGFNFEGTKMPDPKPSVELASTNYSPAQMLQQDNADVGPASFGSNAMRVPSSNLGYTGARVNQGTAPRWSGGAF